jgi:hypothetical protein
MQLGAVGGPRIRPRSKLLSAFITRLTAPEARRPTPGKNSSGDASLGSTWPVQRSRRRYPGSVTHPRMASVGRGAAGGTLVSSSAAVEVAAPARPAPFAGASSQLDGLGLCQRPQPEERNARTKITTTSAIPVPECRAGSPISRLRETRLRPHRAPGRAPRRFSEVRLLLPRAANPRPRRPCAYAPDWIRTSDLRFRRPRRGLGSGM